MKTQRQFRSIEHAPLPEPGFIGPEHTAVEVLGTQNMAASDPFVLLMDDRLDMPKRRAIGGPHPHAGLETVTLVLDGRVFDKDEGALNTGDAVWMTAGRGIVHNEHVEAEGRVRILQLWIGLSAARRNSEPRFEVIRKADVPKIVAPGVQALLYSGKSAGRVSKTKNHEPVTLVDITLEPGATFAQDLPASYNGFAYVIYGSASVGKQHIEAAQTAWLDRTNTSGESELTFTAGNSGARIVLYAGEPHGSPMVHHGPFIAGSRHELATYFQAYQLGTFIPMSKLAHKA